MSRSSNRSRGAGESRGIQNSSEDNPVLVTQQMPDFLQSPLDKSKRVSSVPAMSQLVHKSRLTKRYRSFNNGDLGGNSADAELFRSEIRRTPMIAVPGIGMGIRALSAAFSMNSLTSKNQRASVGSESDSEQDDIPDIESRLTCDLVLAVLVACLSAWQVGFHTGVLNVPQENIKANLQEGHPIGDTMWSFVVAVFAIAALFGSLAAGSLTDALGRKKMILAINIFFLLGGITQALAIRPWMMLVGRACIGIGAGAVTVTVPLYLGEISPAHLRGTLGTLYQFSMVIGILSSNLIAQPFQAVSPPSNGWRYLLGSALIPSVLQFALAPVLKESPLWLVGKGRDTEALAVLAAIRGVTDHTSLQFQLEVLHDCIPNDEEEDQSQDGYASMPGEEGGSRSGNTPSKKLSTMSVLLDPAIRYQLCVGLALMFAQQASGINAVFYYSSAIFSAANLKDPWMGTVLASSVNVVATAVSIPLMDKVGRRGLLMISSMGMFLSCTLVTAVLYLQKHDGIPGDEAASSSPLLNIMSVGGILVYVIFFELGLGPVPWLMSAEIFPAHSAATCCMATSAVNWIFNFAVGVSFPTIKTSLDAFSFVPFGVVCLLCFLGTARYVPETKGKTAEEIMSLFDSRGR